MAGAERSWTKILAVAVLFMVTGAADHAQSARTQSIQDGFVGSLSGQLTDLHSKPLEGVVIVVRNQATGVETRTITTKNGTYRFSGLEAGEYALEAESLQLGRGRVEGIVIDASHEAQVHVAMELAPLSSEAILAELRQMNQPDFVPETQPAYKAEFAVEPLHLLPVRGRRLTDVLGYGPKTEILAVNLTLPAEPLRLLSLHGQRLADVLGYGPGTETPVLSATLAAKPLRRLALAERRLPYSALPVTEASRAATATMSAAELQALPVNGRRWQDFVLDNTPTSTTPAGGQGPVSLHGAGQPAEISVDGVGHVLAFGRTTGSGQGSTGRGALGQNGDGPAGMAQVGAGGHGLVFSQAAIRVVQTLAGNVEAAAARAAGGRMNVETQSGANELHGQGFIFDRGNFLNAQNPFAQWVKETAQANGTTVPVPVFTPESYTPPDRETTWGIGVGSRIRRDKLFWFAALDSYQRNDPGLATVKHPCLEYSNGVCTTGFFAQPKSDQALALCARLGLTVQGPPGTQPYCPTADVMTDYSQMLETLAGMLGPAPRTATQWTGFGRLDWQAAERHRFTLEGIGARWNAPGGGLTRVSETYGNHSFGSSKASEEWLLGRWEAFLTPNLLAMTQASAGRVIQEARPETPSTYEQTLLAGNAWGQLPQIVVDSGYGFTFGNPSRFGQGSYPDEHLYQGHESVDWVRGKLLVKAGFEVSHNADTTSLLRNQTGTYTYSNLENFVSDALVFKNFPGDPLDPLKTQRNCDETGTVWRDSQGTLRGVGNLPCYSYYSQTMGPSDWRLSTNDWAGYVTAQCEPAKLVVFSAGLRWEREQLPPPLAALNNTDLPLTEKLPSLGNKWGPRVSLAVGSTGKHWPVLRLGYGMYYGRTGNLALETVLTQTGSLKGDLNFFMRPTDNLNYGGAPPFPYVLRPPGPGSVVKPGAVEFASGFHNLEVHQAEAAVEETLPGHVEVTASAMMSLGRRLPISIDTNFDPAVNPGTITFAVKDSAGAGPLKAAQITVPFYASWPSATSPAGFAGRLNPDYQQITQIMSRANSTYEAWMLKVVRYSRRGVIVRAHYTYAHAMDWNPNESGQVAGSDVLDPADFSQEYGTSNLDTRHSAGITLVYEATWKLSGLAGKLGNGWMLSGVGQARGGLPYTMRVSGSLAKCFVSTGIAPCTTSYQGLNATAGAAIVGLGPGMNGSGGDNRIYGVGRNTYRYPSTWKADLRLGRRFDLGHMRQLELLAESFNLFNHQNVTELETTGYTIGAGSPSSPYPTLNFLTGLTANSTAFGQPLNINATNFYRERQIQFGLRMRF